MLKIWGRVTSLNAQKVLWCCDEIGLAYERIDAGLAYGVVDTPAYRKLNPNGLVPTIDEDGFVLWESQAIIRYLAGRYALGSLCPADPRTRAIADQWMDWNHTAFWPLMRPAFTGLVRTRPGAAEEIVEAMLYLPPPDDMGRQPFEFPGTLRRL